MSLQDLLQKVTNRQLERQLSHQEAYDELVRDFANETDDLDDSELEAILHNAAKSIEDLKADVELLVSRRQWREIADMEPQIRAERDGLLSETEDEKREFKEAQQAHRRRREAFSIRLNELDAKLHQVDEAKRQLVSTAAETRQGMALWDSVKHLRPEKNDIEHKLRHEHPRLKSLESQVKNPTRNTPPNIVQLRDECAELVRRLEERLDSVDAQFEAVRRQTDDLHDEAMTA